MGYMDGWLSSIYEDGLLTKQILHDYVLRESIPVL